MKPTHVALFATLGMMLTSISVYSLAPVGGSTERPGADVASPELPIGTTRPIAGDAPLVPTDQSRFTSGSRLMLDGRVGHARLSRTARETFLMFEIRAEAGAKAQAPVNLALVIDRSGSMKGSRLSNAIQAAATAIDRLNDGDAVSVVAFDTRTSVIVPPTTIGPDTRGRILAGLRGIGLGGDTCVSCGIEEGLVQLAQTSDRVSRMLVLSDGDANHGVRDVPGFRAMAQRARDRGVSITTIGVDVDYNEKILSAIAQESNGRHYFVENDAGLARIFDEEAQQLTTTVATSADLAIDLAPSVELDRVFDRSFRRAGNRIIVPLDTFASGDVKTVLLKVRLPERGEGMSPLADVEMTYRDLVARNEARCAGKLGVEIADGARDDLDPLVAGRLQRSETAATLKQANFLFEQGRFGEARRKLEEQRRAIEGTADKAKRTAPSGRAKDLERDFDGQIAALESASAGFGAASPEPARTFATPPPGVAGAVAAAPPPPAPQSRAAKGAVRRNEETAVQLGR